MKLRKIVFATGFISTGIVSVLAINRYKFEKAVDDHVYFDSCHDGNIIAHRGFSSVEVENSSSAVKKGFKLDCCDGVEIDVRLTKDNKVVLYHDPIISDLGKVADNNYSEIKKEKYKTNDKKLSINTLLIGKDSKIVFERQIKKSKTEEKIPLLKNIVEKNDYEKMLIVDIKYSDNYDDLSKKLNDIFEVYNGNLKIIFQSDDYKGLSKMKEKYPDYDYQLIIKRNKDLKYLDNEFDSFCIRKNLITKKITNDIMLKGGRVCVWTINSYEDYKELYNKLDEVNRDVYIISDYPDEICYLFNNSKKLSLKK